MKYLAVFFAALAFVAADEEHGVGERMDACQRENHNEIILRDGDRYDIMDLAFSHGIQKADGDTPDCRKNINYGIEKTGYATAVIYARGCGGKFLFDVDYVPAHCELHKLKTKPGHSLWKKLRTPCVDGSVFEMTPVYRIRGECIPGDTFGFNQQNIWADDGCSGVFKVCEVAAQGDHDGDGVNDHDYEDEDHH